MFCVSQIGDFFPSRFAADSTARGKLSCAARRVRRRSSFRVLPEGHLPRKVLFPVVKTPASDQFAYGTH